MPVLPSRTRPIVPALRGEPAGAPLGGADALRRDEARLILLNLSVLAGLALLHVLFSSTLGRPPRVFYLAIFGRLLMQVLELLWLQTAGGRLSERLLPAYRHLSIALHLGFAFLLSRLGGFEDSHYVALMVIPVLAAGFRYRWPGITLVVAAAVGLTFLEVRLYYADNPARMNVTEYFEASNVMLIYVVVAVVAALLSRRLRAERAAVEHNLEALERTRDQLVREEKLAAVGRLSAAIAHEIRNPVSLILSSLDLAREGGPGALPEDEVRDIVHQEARRLETLTGDFLLYARQRPPQRRPTALGETLEYVASLLRSRLEERRLDLVLEPPPDLEVEADPFQLHQALLNLLANAVDAAEAGEHAAPRRLPGVAAGGCRVERCGAHGGAGPSRAGRPLRRERRRRHPAAGRRADLRAVLHHQALRHRPRAGHRPRDRPPPRRRPAPGGQPAGGGALRDHPARPAPAAGAGRRGGGACRWPAS